MATRRDFLKKSGGALAGIALANSLLAQVAESGGTLVSPQAGKAHKPFKSKAVADTIAEVKAKIKDAKLAAMFEKCYPNTLDTTVNCSLKNGLPDTFVITGDIFAMWLRDSSAQVAPYLSLLARDEELKNMVNGLIRRQAACVCIDPYANAFNEGPTGGEWQSDLTKMKPELHERKWEIDSLCYTIRLAYRYWKETGDLSPFDAQWQRATQLIYQTFTEQQRKTNLGPYKFQRRTERALDTLSNNGWGNPVNPVGLIVSSFRPSDDATTFGFLVPSNLFAVVSLRQLAEMYTSIVHNPIFAEKCRALANEVENAVKKYAIIERSDFGKVYAFEVDGFGNALFMDDANVPSLLSLPYLGYGKISDEVYQNTRRLVWSTGNPYFFKGKAAEGIGGPHVGYDYIWPMSIIMRALTAGGADEIMWCVRTLRNTDAGTGFMHESFHKDDASKFTRSWFAWANTLFGELIVKLVQQGFSL